jgi:AraC-like DNA-binding protein
MDDSSTDGLTRLERSCVNDGARRDWFQVAPGQDGFLRVEADLKDFSYAPHRHDTYAIGITLAGVQTFNYRRARRDCVPGQVIVLHPDEAHDGQAGTEQGFRYRMLYLEPAEIRTALGGSASTLPFLQNGHGNDPRLRDAVAAALREFDRPVTELERVGLVQAIADALLNLDPKAARRTRAADDRVSRAVECARDLLHAEARVSASELEAVTGLCRFEMTRQFRSAFGTSPYRFHQMRRLDRARAELKAGMGIAAAAHLYGFSDQSHFTRQFKSAFGLTPGQWLRMVTAGVRHGRPNTNHPPIASN